jgi:hypothetical protein
MVDSPRTSNYIKFQELAPGRFEGEQKQEPRVWNREPEYTESSS